MHFTAVFFLWTWSSTVAVMLINRQIISNSPSLTEPLIIQSVNGVLNVTLSVDVVRVVNGLFSYTTRGYCYNSPSGTKQCSVPGPTLSLQQGDSVRLTLINNLKQAETTTRVMNQMRYPNRTNLHTHGLHISPDVDNVFVYTKGDGDSVTYNYKISADHAPGNHWYHSHIHGASALQVMGGLVGALNVAPSNPYDIPAALRAMTRKTLVFTHMMLDDIVTSSNAPFDCWSYAKLTTQTQSSLLSNPVYTNISIKDAWFVNGQYQPINHMNPGEWQIFDMVAASGDRTLELEIRTAIGRDAGVSACEMRLLALDGVYLTATRSGTYVDHFPMIQAQRATMAVRCAAVGVYYFQTAAPTQSTDSLYNKISTSSVASVQLLVKLEVSGASMSSMADPPADLSTIPRPSYLEDLRSATLTAAPRNWSMATDESGCCGVGSSASFWMGMGSDCTLECFGGGDCTALFGTSYTVSNLQSVIRGTCSFQPFQGQLGISFPSYRVKHTLNTVAELDLWGRGLDNHPLHIHVNHFQIQKFNDAAKQPIPKYKYFGEYGDWRDTWPALAGRTVIRTIYTDFVGEYVTHCHFLKHEDMGMMATFYVGGPPTVTPSGAPSTALPSLIPTLEPSTSMPTAPPPIIAPVVAPSCGATFGPTCDPSVAPSSLAPTRKPSTFNPSVTPTVTSTFAPSYFSSVSPSSRTPSTQPSTTKPTMKPSTFKPTTRPTAGPTTRLPSIRPSTKPTASPTTRRPSTTPTTKPSTARPVV